MPERAHVTSIEALEVFRRGLVLYADKARAVLEEVGTDIVRMKLWLQTEQRGACERLVRRREKELQEARQALFNARLSNPHGASAPDQTAVRKATHALREAEAKLARVKYWGREFERRAEALDAQLNKMRNVLAQTVPKSLAYLKDTARTLGAYAETLPTATSSKGGGASEDDGP
jgi:hypothetical protein